MSGSSVQILAQAHACIEAGNLEDAENLIRSLLEQDPENTDAWWLLAHSVRDSFAARDALGQVLRLDPNDQQARSLLSALDERFPSEESPGRRSRLRIPRPRLPRPRMPSIQLRGDNGSYFRPVSMTVLVIVLVVGGWLALRYLGIELVPVTATPVESSSESALIAQAEETPEVVGPTPLTSSAGAETSATAITDVTSISAITASPEVDVTSVSQADQTLEASSGETGSEIIASDQLAATVTSDAPIASVTSSPDSGAQGTPTGGSDEGGSVAATVTPSVPSASPTPVPTYPYPTQTDAEEFALLYLNAFAQAGLELIIDTPTLEGTVLGSTALANVCLRTSRGLRNTINESMELMATFAAHLLNSAPALGVRIVDCAQENVTLRIIAAPLESASEWSDGTLERSAFQATWVAAG